MNCPNCKNQINEGAIECPFCKTKLIFQNANTEQPLVNSILPTNISQNSSKPVNKKSPNIIMILLILLIIASGSYFVINSHNNSLNNNQETESDKENNQTTEPPKTQEEAKPNNNEKDDTESNEIKEEIKNYNINITLYMVTNNIRIKQISSGVIDEVHQREYLSIYTTLNDAGVSNKAYYDYNSGNIYISDSNNKNEWTLHPGTATQPIDQSYLLDKLSNNDGIENIDENHYRIKLSNTEMKRLIGSNDLDLSSLTGDMFVDVYKKNGYIVRLEYNFSESFNNVDEFKITIKYSNFNKPGDVIIPQEIIDNAKNI